MSKRSRRNAVKRDGPFRHSSFVIPSSFVIRISSLGNLIRCVSGIACVFLFAAVAQGQIQVDLKFKRMQYIAYEPVVATLALTNLAGRDIELHDANGQSWLAFELTGSDEQPIGPLRGAKAEPALKIAAGQRVTKQIDLTPLYP